MSIPEPDSCRLCGATENQTLRAPHVFGGEGTHQFWECAQCSAVYLFPIPSQEDEDRFYREEFEKFMSSRAGTERDWENAENHIKTNQDQVVRRWRYLEPFVEEGKSLLEIGCSTGFMMDAFRDAGMESVGIEPSGEFLDFLQQRDHKAYETLEDLQTAEHEARFDLIVHFFVFEHIRDPFAFLREQYELLKPGGAIVAEIPCVSDPLTEVYNIPAFEKFYWSIAHHYYYSKQSMEYVMDRLGYDYELLPEQRYDISNHFTWMMDGKPGGQGRFSNLISQETLDSYRKDLMDSFTCDTVILVVRK
jgi:SAM-dependent methyltransferase